MRSFLKPADARVVLFDDASGVVYESQPSEMSDGRVRRGPLRPSVWFNARQRNGIRLRVFYYRGLDIVITALATLGWLAYPDGIGVLLSVPLGTFTPYFAGWLLALAFIATSHRYNFSSPRNVLLHTLVTVAVAALGLCVGFVLNAFISAEPWQNYAEWSVLLLGMIAVLHGIWAVTVAHGRKTGALVPNVAFVGATEPAQRLIEAALKRRDINILGIFDDRADRRPESICGVPVLGCATDLLDHRLTPYLDCIALTISTEGTDRVEQLRSRLSVLPNRIMVVVQGDRQQDQEINDALNKLAYAPVALLNHVNNPDLKAFYKRLQDLVCGTLGLIAISPVLLLIALAIRLDSPGPALFRQRRHGFNHEEIVVWKFRTMRHDQADHAGRQQVVEDDPRVTRIGRFLRSTSLDELPQLINVLLGQMSLVGPRPHAIGMQTGHMAAADIVEEYAHRHRIKPGMTGWAAINGSRGPMHTAADVRRRVQLDIDYIERQSFWFDMWIMLVTIPVIFGDRIATR